MKEIVTFGKRSNAADSGTDSAVVPVGVEISPNHGFNIDHSHFRGVSFVKFLLFEPAPHTLSFSVVVTSAPGRVHALDNSEFIKGFTEIRACVLAASVRVKHCASHGRVQPNRVIFCICKALKTVYVC